MYNIDFSILHELLMDKNPKLLGKIPLSKNNSFEDMVDVIDFLDTIEDSKNKFYIPEMDMIELHLLQRAEKCPPVIKDISKEIKKFKPFKNRILDVVGFIGFDNAIGYNWHYDDYHLIAMNIIGNTVWHFKDHNAIEMSPGDLMFVPSPVEHKVVGTTERFTVSFCCPTHKNRFTS
jgi:hypothetical protein